MYLHSTLRCLSNESKYFYYNNFQMFTLASPDVFYTALGRGGWYDPFPFRPHLSWSFREMTKNAGRHEAYCTVLTFKVSSRPVTFNVWPTPMTEMYIHTISYFFLPITLFRKWLESKKSFTILFVLQRRVEWCTFCLAKIK